MLTRGGKIKGDSFTFLLLLITDSCFSLFHSFWLILLLLRHPWQNRISKNQCEFPI